MAFGVRRVGAMCLRLKFSAAASRKRPAASSVWSKANKGNLDPHYRQYIQYDPLQKWSCNLGQATTDIPGLWQAKHPPQRDALLRKRRYPLSARAGI